MRVVAVVAALAITATTVARAAGTTPSQRLNDGRTKFLAGNFADAKPILNELVYPDEQLARIDDLVEDYTMLGACELELGEPDKAARDFRKAAKLQPDRELQPNIFSTSAIKVFEEQKAKVAAENKAIDDAKRLKDLADAVEAYKKSVQIFEVHPYSRNFVPFGAGQFQNKTPVRGVIFAATEAVTLSISVGTWFYLVNRFGFNAKLDRTTDTATFHTVQHLEQLEIATGVAFIALYAGGVIDALLHYQPRVRDEFDESLLPPELRPKPKAPPPKPKKTSFRLLPMIGDGVAGVGIGWEN